jgi:putative heme-binding domain-containing protein
MLTRMLKEQTGQAALDALWALNLSGGFNETVAFGTLDHADPYVRLWTVRLLGDDRQVSSAMAEKLARLATKESHPEVRSQLACSARRLPAQAALPILRRLLARDEDAGDIHIPLLLWWAIEAKADSDRNAIMRLFQDSAMWKLPLVEKHILERLMRRYAQAGKQKDLLTCARLLDLAPGPEHARKLLAGFEQAFAGRSLAGLPDELVKALAKRGGGSLSLRLRQKDAAALEEALKIVGDSRASVKQRLSLVQILGEMKEPRSLPLLLEVVSRPGNEAMRQAALTALLPFDDLKIGARLITTLTRRASEGGSFPDEVRRVALGVLAARKTWARQLLEAIDQGTIDRAVLPLDLVRKMTVHRDARIAALIQKHWGKVEGATTSQMQKEIDRWQMVLGKGTGSPYAGKKLFAAHCARCHTLFGQGGQIGPDLTTYKRDDLATMLLNIVNPSAEVREGFETHLVLTSDGRALTGFLVERDNRLVVLRNAEGQDVTLARTAIEEMRVLPQSLMPEGLLSAWTDQQVRDLFAYLRSTQPLND